MLKDNQGFSLVEVLLAATIFGLLVMTLVGAIVYGRAASADSGDNQRATMLAEEGLEATRNVARAAYANLVDGTYGLVQSGGQWTLSGSSDTSGIFTRQITIATAGTNHRTVTSTVTWSQLVGGTGSVTLTARLTNWAAALKSWSNAAVAGSYASGTTAGYRVDTAGNYAYLVRNTSSTTNFFIINISNPAAPSLAGSLTLPNTPTNVFVSGNYAYVSNSNTSGELQIVNVTNPAAPSLTSTFNAPGTAGGGLSVFVSGNYAYLGRAANSANGELTIINVSNPASPTQAGIYSNNLAMNKVIVSGTTAYIATNNTADELLIVNVANPASPTLTKAFNLSTTAAATSLAVVGTNVFIAAGTSLVAVNAATPSSPTQTSTLTLTGTASDVDVDITGSYLFLGSTNTSGEMQVINVSNPASMSLVKSVDVSGTSSTVTGVSYDASLDVVVGASASTTQQLVTVTRN